MLEDICLEVEWSVGVRRLQGLIGGSSRVDSAAFDANSRVLVLYAAVGHPWWSKQGLN